MRAPAFARRALAPALVLIAAVGCGQGARESGEAGDTIDAAAAPIDPEWLARVTEARSGLIARGSTLQDALTGVGLEAAEALAIAAAVDDVWSVRSLRAGTIFTLSVTAFGEPTAFEIWPDAVDGVRAEKNGGIWEAQAARRALFGHVRYVTGVVESSFYESIVAEGGDAELVLRVSDILQWDVDFFIDPRKGDRYAILVETWADGRDVVRYGDILAVEYEGQQTRASAYLHRNGEKKGYYRLDGESVQRSLLKSPLNYRRISSHFSHRRFHPILHRYRPHLGVDYAADVGTPVVTIGDGTVEFAGTRGGYGRLVVVRHNARLTTQYAHLSKFARGVRTGARVSQGDVIGYVGSTGLSTGPHLDFRCKVNGSFVNPLTLERPPAEPVPENERPGFLAETERFRRALVELPSSGFVERATFDASFPPAASAQEVPPTTVEASSG